MNSPYQAYQKSAVQTTPAQLVLMLYDGAIRFTKAGIDGIQKREYDVANTNLKKAQSIINELIASLNYDYPISKNLVRVYEYMLHQLIQANIKKKKEPASEVLEHLQELREVWKQTVKTAGSQTQLDAGLV